MNTLRLTKIIKVGNSLAVVIPKDILNALSIERGDQVSFGVYSDDVICIRKISQRDLLNLKPKQPDESSI
jgi:antitoxin component of MazEF toxin-antitoxin module